MIRRLALLPLLLGACATAEPQGPGRISVEVYQGLGGGAAGSFLPAVELLVDATPSMDGAVAGSTTRLQAAQAKAVELLASLPAGSQASVSAFGAAPGAKCRRAERLSPLRAASDPELADALAGLRAESESSPAAALVALANDLVSQGRARDTRVVLFSDLDGSCGGDLCAAAARLVATGAWLDVALLGDASIPACLADLRPSAELPGALVRALTRPAPVWHLVAPGEGAEASAVSDSAGPHPLEAPPGEWWLGLDLERPTTLGPLRIAAGRLTRVRVLAFSGGPPRFAWEIVDERR